MNESLPNEVYIVEATLGGDSYDDLVIIGLRYTYEGATKLAEDFNKVNDKNNDNLNLIMPVDYYKENLDKSRSCNEEGNYTYKKFGKYTAKEWAIMDTCFEEPPKAIIKKMEIK